MDNSLQPYTWMCPLTKTGKRSAHSTCAKAFAKEHDFQLIDTSDDGNCFFYALTKFGKRAHYDPLVLHSNEHKNSMLLRQQLVDYMESHMDKFSEFLYHNNNAGTVNEQINELRQNGAWASEAGDLVPVAGAHAFRINMDMFNIVVGADRDIVERITIYSEEPSDVHVSIMRVNEGHFELLWPRSQSITRPFIAKNASSSHDAISAAQIAVSAAQIAVSAAKESTNSIQHNEQKLNQLVSKLDQLSLSPTRASTRRQNNSIASRVSARRTRTSTRKKKEPRSYMNGRNHGNNDHRNNHHRNNYQENDNNNLRRALEASLAYPSFSQRR